MRGSWELETQLLRRLEVHGELESGAPLDGKIRRSGTLHDTINVVGATPHEGVKVVPIRHQTALFLDNVSPGPDRRPPLLPDQREDAVELLDGRPAVLDNQAID